jgi:peptide chain release factor 2
MRSLLDGPHDLCNAIVSIYARDGGTDANDWAEMLLRCIFNGLRPTNTRSKVLDRQDDLAAGIQSATTFAIRGPMDMAYLKGETGMHRWFASVPLTPKRNVKPVSRPH